MCVKVRGQPAGFGSLLHQVDFRSQTQVFKCGAKHLYLMSRGFEFLLRHFTQCNPCVSSGEKPLIMLSVEGISGSFS